MSERWIVSQRADAVIFFGVPLLALLLGSLTLVQPWVVVPLFWAWLLLIDGPHLFVTGLRSFLDPSRASVEASWRRHWWMPFIIPMLAFVLAQLQPQWRTMDLLLTAGAIYSWHHLTRQHEGVMAIYHAQTGGRGPAPERLWLRSWLWSAFVLAAVATPANRAIWLTDVNAADVARLMPILNATAVVLALVTVACVLMYLRKGLHRINEKQALRPWWFGLLPVGTVSTLSLLAIGWFEPLYATPTHPEQYFLVVTLVTGMLHGTQYLGIVLAGNWRRYGGKSGGADNSANGDASAAHWVARLSRKPMLTLTLCLALSLTLYLALNATRANLPVLQWFDMKSPIAQFAFALYWGLFFHHYYVDNKIWRVRSDPALRSELAIS